MRTHRWVLIDGTTSIAFDKDVLTTLDMRASTIRTDSNHKPEGHSGRPLTFATEAGSTLIVEESRDGVIVTAASLRHRGALEIAVGSAQVRLGALTLSSDGLPIGDIMAHGQDGGGAGLLLRDVRMEIDNDSGEVILTTDFTTLSPALAAELSVAGQVNGSVGTVTFRGRFARVPVDESSVEPVEGLLDFDHSQRVVSGGSVGPDVIVLSLPSVGNYGSEIDPETEERISAFSVATTSCNIGDEPATWIPDINQHPVIGQNLYRLKEGKFEQIGMSWLKHGFFAVRGNQCGSCIDPPGVTGHWLGVSCSDPYSSNLNGTQSNLGPRSAVNAYTGLFPFPFNRAHLDDNIDRRLQVKTADIDPDLNVGALFFVEGHYVTPDDALAGNHFNNASYRRVVPVRPNIGNNYCLNPMLDLVNDVCLFTTSSTREQLSAVHAWHEHDDTVQVTEALVPGEGKFEVAVKVTNLGDGFWRYRYAVFNLNSHRSGGSFTVPIPEGAVVRNLEFSAPFYHSGEFYDDAPWTATVEEEAVVWATTPFDEDPNANALRWSTLYSFGLEASVPPEDTSVTIGLFKPGTPSIVTAATMGPAAGFVDCNLNGISDTCDISCAFPGCAAPDCGTSADCNENLLPDECEPDCNENDIADACDIRDETSTDCDENNVPDECDPDCDNDGTPDACEEDLDADDDGVDDCDDLCPETTPPGLCLCPTVDRCCYASGFCIDNYPRTVCIAQGGTPDCQSSPCRDGCLVGDWDVDGDLDLFDMSMLLTCFTGYDAVGQAQPSAECVLRFDYDEEQDIDGDDFKQFQDDFTGPH